MSRCIRNVYPSLTLLADKKTSSRLFTALVDTRSAYNNDLLKSIAEILHNILYGHPKLIKLSSAGKRVLKQYRKSIEKLAVTPKKGEQSAKRRKLLMKVGPKILPVLLPPALKILSDLAADD